MNKIFIKKTFLQNYLTTLYNKLQIIYIFASKLKQNRKSTLFTKPTLKIKTKILIIF